MADSRVLVARLLFNIKHDPLSFSEAEFNYIIKNRKEYIATHHILDDTKFPVL